MMERERLEVERTGIGAEPEWREGGQTPIGNTGVEELPPGKEDSTSDEKTSFDDEVQNNELSEDSEEENASPVETPGPPCGSQMRSRGLRVSNLPTEANQENLRQLFAQFGKVQMIKVTDFLSS